MKEADECKGITKIYANFNERVSDMRVILKYDKVEENLDFLKDLKLAFYRIFLLWMIELSLAILIVSVACRYMILPISLSIIAGLIILLGFSTYYGLITQYKEYKSVVK